MTFLRPLNILVSTLVSASLFSPALAQVAPGATRDLTGPQDQFEVRPPAGIQLEGPPVPGAQVLTDGTVILRRIRFEGLTAFEPSTLSAVVAPWLGRPVGAPELTKLVGAVTEALRERGLYAAAARFTAQEMTEGVAVIEVIEGRVGHIEIERDATARLKPQVAKGFLSGLRPGAPIARGVLDTPLLLLNDLPGVVVQPALVPGAERGTADLLVGIEDQPMLAGFVRLDNHQIRELGEYELTGHLRLRNPLGLGDLATAELVRSRTGGRTRAAFTYSAPVGYRGTRLGALYSRQRYRIGGAFEPLLANGDHDRVTLLAAHPIVRQDNANLSGSLAVSQVEYHDRFDAVGFSSDSRHRYGTLRLYGDRADSYGAGGRAAFYVEYQAGEVSLRTPAVAAADALGVAGSFGRTRLHLERVQGLTPRAALFAGWTAQIASKNLDSGRDIDLAGPDGVRAYPVGELIVDEGHLARVEYRHLLPIADGWRMVGALFLDGASGKLNKNPLAGATGNRRDIWGYGFSLSASHRSGFQTQLQFAWQGSEAPLTDPARHPRFWFALTQYF